MKHESYRGVCWKVWLSVKVSIGCRGIPHAVERSGVIVAHALTDATVDDAAVGIDLIGAVAGDVGSVTGMAPTTRGVL